MANTVLTHKMIARRAADMLVHEDNVIPNINTGYNGEFGTPVQGYKRGESIKIGIPPTPVTWTGSAFKDHDVAESYVDLKLDHQIGSGLKFTAVEKKLDVAEFQQRFLRPTMNAVRTQVQAYLLGLMEAGANQAVGKSGTVPAARKTYAQAQACLDRGLAPTDMRTMLYSSDANVELVDTNASIFNPQASLAGAFKSGYQGHYAGFDFGVNQLLAVQKGSAATGTKPSAVTSNGSALTVSGLDKAVPAGTILTMAGVYGTDPITGESNGQLRQFRVTADVASAGTSIPISPSYIKTDTSNGVIGTVPNGSALGTITYFDTETSGVRQGLGFQKNAFAAAFAPLPVLAGLEGYTATNGNVSVRVMSFGDGVNDLERTRVDVLVGGAVIRPDHIVRVTE